MLAIQLNPNLHQVVHLLNSVEMREIESPSLDNLSLSKEETSALISTFQHPAKSRTISLLSPLDNWF